MKKITTLILILLTIILGSKAQPPQSMKYKAIAKDQWGLPLPRKSISLRFTIYQGSENGTIVYMEKHHTTTTLLGLMDVNIGEGTPQMGNFSDIDWGAANYYIKVELDPRGGNHFILQDDAQQLLSVPYALYAGNVQHNDDADSDPQNELISNVYLSGTMLYIIEGNQTTMVNLTGLQDGVEDADADPTNELQNLSVSDHELALSGGNTITLPDNVNDADANPENEIQDLHLSGNILSITKNGAATLIDLSVFLDNTDDQQLEINGHELTIDNGNSVTLPDNVNDADNDPQNELQVLSVDGYELTLSNGNTITLPDEVNDADNNPANEIQVLSLENNILTLSTNADPIQIDLTPYLDNTDAQNLNIDDHLLSIHNGNSVQLPDSVNDADHDPHNELQMLSIDDHQLSIDNGNAVQLPDSVNDADHDPSNEIQVLSLGHDTIYLSNGGYIKLPSVQTMGGQYYYADKDGDGFGDKYFPVWVSNGIITPEFYVDNKNDCDDNDFYTNPSAQELLNDMKDNDCDGILDESNPDYIGNWELTEPYLCDASSFIITRFEISYEDNTDFIRVYSVGNSSSLFLPNISNNVDQLMFFHKNELNDQNLVEITITLHLVDIQTISVGINFIGKCTDYVNYTAIKTPIDKDGDGFFFGEDCDDNNSNIYPGAIEICGDGIDQDCNPINSNCGLSDIDDDFDGYSELDGDCNDDDPRVYPGQLNFFLAPSNHYLRFDFNCDGIEELQYPDLVSNKYPGTIATCGTAGKEYVWSVTDNWHWQDKIQSCR